MNMDFKSAKELLDLCEENQLPISEVMRQRECILGEVPRDAVDHRMAKAWEIMHASATQPLKKPIKSMGGLIGGEAKRLSLHEAAGMQLCGKVLHKAMTRAMAVLETNAKGGAGTAKFAAAVRELLRDKLEAYAQKGQVGRVVRVMVLGIPNVGKSTFINKVARRKTAKAEDRPGVTRSKQWVPVDSTLELLDTPGILWPKFDDPEVGKRLAFTGAIKDDVLDIEELACYLMEYLGKHYTSVLEERYKIAVEPEDSGYDLLEKAGRKRGFLMRGAQVDTERMARILLEEFRGGKLGRFTLETVEDAT